MRCRGVVVRSLDGHMISQNPHSMHLSMISCTFGRGFRSSRYTRGLSLMITPGLRRRFGSKARLIRFINAYAFSPHSISTNGAMFRPVPCSPLRDPSYFLTVMSHTSSISRW